MADTIINNPGQQTLPDLTDHNALITLVESVKNIREGQDKFHLDIKAQIDDLKNNFAARLDNVETSLRTINQTFVAKSEQDTKNELFRKGIEANTDWINRAIGAVIIINLLLGFVIVYLQNHH